MKPPKQKYDTPKTTSIIKTKKKDLESERFFVKKKKNYSSRTKDSSFTKDEANDDSILKVGFIR